MAQINADHVGFNQEVETAIKAIIADMDLSMVAHRLITAGKWRKRRVEPAIQAYKKFLFLQRKYINEYSLVPSIEIDAVWHEHILFTQQYHEDCQRLFGRYLHHQPETNVGKFTLSATDNKQWAELTEKLYFQEYGEYIYGEPLEWPAWVKAIQAKVRSLKCGALS